VKSWTLKQQEFRELKQCWDGSTLLRSRFAALFCDKKVELPQKRNTNGDESRQITNKK
jgi:hypothetical protein